MAAGDVTATISKPTGKALYFDGINDFVNCGNKTSTEIIKEITMSAWVYSSSLNNGFNVLIEKQQMYTMYLHNAAGNYTIGFNGGTGVGWGSDAFSPDNTFQLNEWHHIGVTLKKNTLKIYYDGVKVKETTHDITGTNNNDLMLGAGGGGGNPFKGKLTNAKLHNIALTAVEMMEEYKKHETRKGLKGQWSFYDTSDPGHDDSNNGNDGTVTGAISTGGHDTIEDDIKETRVAPDDVWAFIPLANNQEIMMVNIEGEGA